MLALNKYVALEILYLVKLCLLLKILFEVANFLHKLLHLYIFLMIKDHRLNEKINIV